MDMDDERFFVSRHIRGFTKQGRGLKLSGTLDLICAGDHGEPEYYTRNNIRILVLTYTYISRCTHNVYYIGTLYRPTLIPTRFGYVNRIRMCQTALM